MNDSSSRARDLLACLGDSSRFQLVLHLLISERCASDLALDVGLSQSCTTRHLQVLERAGIVCGARDGKRVLFRLCREKPHVDGLIVWALREAEALEAGSELSAGTGNGPVRGRARSARRGGPSPLGTASGSARPTPESSARQPARRPTASVASASRTPPSVLTPVAVGHSGHDSDEDAPGQPSPEPGGDTVLTPLRRSDFEDYLL